MLFISFDQTIQLFDVDEKIKVSDFEETLIHQLGLILKNYLKNKMSTSPWKNFPLKNYNLILVTKL